MFFAQARWNWKKKSNPLLITRKNKCITIRQSFRNEMVFMDS